MNFKTRQYSQFVVTLVIVLFSFNNNAFACKKHKKNKKNKTEQVTPKEEVEEIEFSNEESIKKIDSLLSINFIESKYQKSKIYTARAFHKFQINDSLNAIEDCNKAIQLDSSYHYPYYLLSLYYGQNMEYQKAIDIADIGMLNCQNETLKLFRLKANNLQALGKYNEALSMYNILIDHDNNDGSNFFNKGTILLLQRKYNASINYFHNALYNYIDRNQGYDYEIAAYNNIAYAYLMQQNLNEFHHVLENYTKSLEIEKNIDTYLGLCIMYYLQNNNEMLDKYFNLAIQERPNLKNGKQEIINMMKNDDFYYFPETIELLEEIFNQKLKK